MRKTLLSLTILAGIVTLGAGAEAATVDLAPAIAPDAQVQTVQYYGYPGWHAHHYWWHRRHEAWVRHREFYRWHGFHGRPGFRHW